MTKKPSLSERECCSSHAHRLRGHALISYQQQLPQGWRVVNHHHLEKTYLFATQEQAKRYVDIIHAMAPRQIEHQLHPASEHGVVVCVSTSKTEGLSIQDFILALQMEQESKRV